MTRIFLKTNKNNFVGELNHIKWDHLFAQSDALSLPMIYLMIPLLHYLISIFYWEENLENLQKVRDG